MTDTINTPETLAKNYRYIQLLGEGANGKTYLAIQLSTGIQVAVKELKFSRLKDFKSLELFKREAATLSSIHIDGIPKFYESIFADTTDDTCYIIQEYVEYPSVQAMIDKISKLSEYKSLDIIHQVALLLYDLQNKYNPPIIHRDIKPSNILCRREKKSYHVYLIDFGAVANPQRRSGGSTIAGTFGYMAPEQLLGDVCIQSDYYALGATLLHMLTGIPPYEIDSNGFELDIHSILSQHAPGTSKATISLLEILLAPEIDKRPNNARQLIDCIDLVKRGKTVSIKTLEDESPVKQPLISPSNPIYTVLKFFHRFLIPRFKPSNSMDYWTETNAMIRYECNVSTFQYINRYKHCFEYTFEVKQFTYVGFYFTDEDLYIAHLNDVNAIECIIAYNPHNPRMNRFIKLANHTHKRN